MKTKVTLELICDDEVFKDSAPVVLEIDDILLKPFRDAGYKLGMIAADRHKGSPFFVYEISINPVNKE